MNWIVELSSFLSLIISFILLINILQFSKSSKFLKILVSLLFITIIGANLLNFIDLSHGFLDGLMGK